MAEGMNLFGRLQSRILGAYTNGEDAGEFLAEFLDNPLTRGLARRALTAATRAHVTRTARRNGMPKAVITERLDVSDVLFEMIAGLYGNGLAASYRAMIPKLFLGKVILPGSPKQDQVLETQGFRPPRTIVISPNMNCNLRCYQCYAPAIGANRRPEEISEESWERLTQVLAPEFFDKVIGEFRDLGGSFITVTGGEPLAYRDKASGTAFIDGSGRGNDIIGRHPDTVFMFFTNAKGLTEGVVRRMGEVGNAIPCLSLEGFEEATDSRRGAGTFQGVMNALDLLHVNGIPHGASVTVFGGKHRNVEEVVSDEFVRLLKGKGVSFTWYFPWFPMMASTREDLELFPSPEDRFYTLRDGLTRIRRKHRLLAFDFSDGLQVNDWVDGRPRNRGCIAAGSGLISVNQDGSVDPCVFYKFGLPEANIKSSSLVEVLNSPYMVRLREYQQTSANPLVPCFPRDHLREMREAKEEFGAVSSSPKCRICEHGDVDAGIMEYNERCREVADDLARRKYGFEPGERGAGVSAAVIDGPFAHHAKASG
jgi:MoaA/NifB/PqqE/SkfB family radical SAM enzyme